jgi:hypothetical protein
MVPLDGKDGAMTVSQQELEERLGLGKVDQEELTFVLSNFIHQAQYTSETRVDYPNAEAPLISLHYGKDGDLRAIEPGVGLTTELVEQIAHDVKSKLLAPARPMVCRMPLFAHVPTDGYWRYKDKLVIRRAPSEAPRPFFLAAPHPLILEVSFSGAADGFIRNSRAQREPRQLALFLSLLIPGLRVPGNNSRKHWAIEIQETPSPAMHSVLVQKSYFIPDFEGFADELSGQGPLPDIQLVESMPRGISAEQVLVLPVGMARYLDIFMQLDEDDRRKILRAAYWLHYSREVWDLSKSANYQSLIQAVETLIEVPRGQPHCPACNRSIGPGPTKLFIEFIDRFAPKPESAEDDGRKMLYRMRSSLTHGDTLLFADVESGFGPHGPQPVYERQLSDQAHSICRRAVVGWLESRGSPTSYAIQPPG